MEGSQKTYWVTVSIDGNQKTFSISGGSAAEIERYLIGNRAKEGVLESYRVAEKPSSTAGPDKVLGELGNATLLFAMVMILTGIVERKLRKWARS